MHQIAAIAPKEQTKEKGQKTKDRKEFSVFVFCPLSFVCSLELPDFPSSMNY